MIVGGFSYVGTLARPATASPPHNLPGTPTRALVEESEEMNESPTYFRSISAISPGSLAAVYQAIRAHEEQAEPTQETAAVRIDKETPDGASEAFILSGLGIPAAMSAYDETLATAGE
jgi:hypothetical protein